MKKLLVLTAVVIVTVAALGCQNCGLFRRGSLFPATMATTTCCEPYDPCSTCDSTPTYDFGGIVDPVLPSPGSP